MENKYLNEKILIVDDEKQFLEVAKFILASEGIRNVLTCHDSREVEKHLKENNISIVLLDIMMPYINGWELLEIIKEEYPHITVVMITADNSDILERAKKSLRSGAYDYIIKPIDKERLVRVIKNLIQIKVIYNENKLLKEQLENEGLKHPEFFEKIITGNSKMHSIFKYIEGIGVSPLPVLITGETGTGKSMLGSVIHNLSFRKGKYVVLNISGEDISMISDTLFGHVKGGFTGATSAREGLIEQAEGGTIFLDEIGDLPEEVQIKLLRVLQEKKYYKIGSDLEQNVDVRFIFATNKELDILVEQGKFRKDLYYRLKFHQIALPSLRERREDIPLLIRHIMKNASAVLKKDETKISRKKMNELTSYDYPGNIRELEGFIYELISKNEAGIDEGSDYIGDHELSRECSFSITKKHGHIEIHGDLPPLEEIRNIEEHIIDKALSISNNNQTTAAKLLGITRKTLNSRLIRRKKKI